MNDLFDIERFMPHGHCYQWDPGILWTSVTSDFLIAAAYTAIPFTLVFQIMRKRKDLPFDWMFACFGLFIVACGLTHVMEIITVWKPYYPISAIIKAITAAASVPTAIILFRIAPKIVNLPTLKQIVREQSLRAKAEAASEAKDRFIAVLSHELRTPLTPVTAGLDLLEDELKNHGSYSTAPAVRDALKMVRRNVEMETMLVNDLLDVSGAARGKLNLTMELIDLKEILHQSLPLFHDAIRDKGIAFDFQLRAERTLVIGAASRLHQIVNNLLSNAIKFTAEKGEIAIALEEHGQDLHLTVRDNGCGIDAEKREKIFQPFEQADRQLAKSQGGLGLGLTIARAIAESHGGHLTAESMGRGRGATFTLQLPLAKEQSRPQTSPPERNLAGAQFKPKILLVDDHADTLRTLASLLRKAGYEVATAESVRQAEPLFSQCEVLITDIGLPDGDGYDLMTRFKAGGGKGGIAISGFGQEEDILRSGRAGFSKHLIKPIDIEVLKAALQALQPVDS